MSARHTPGPWTVSDSRISVGASDGSVAICSPFIKRTSDESLALMCANARLIAAAPDMLAELVALEWSADVDREEGGVEIGCPSCWAVKDDGHAEGCKLAAAIAKATGAA